MPFMCVRVKYGKWLWSTVLLSTLDPIRCTLCVKPGGSRVLTSGQNQLFPSRGYTAETYAKVMGGSPPSQPRIKPKCTLFVC